MRSVLGAQVKCAGSQRATARLPHLCACPGAARRRPDRRSRPNGAGKSNLLEGLYFGCTGYSQRTRNERELVRFGAQAARVVVELSDGDRHHELAVGFQPGSPKHMTADGAPVERLADVQERPLVSVFSPDRLELLKGAPTLRRAHLDQLVAALWPARVGDPPRLLARLGAAQRADSRDSCRTCLALDAAKLGRGACSPCAGAER